MSSVQLRDQKAVFFHIPKTAGNSLSTALWKIPNRKRHPCRGFERPMPIVQYIEKKIPSVWTDCFTFAFVRNPWDWTVSGWKYVTENKCCYTEPPSFDAFVKGQWQVNLGANPFPQKFRSTEICVAVHTQVSQWDHLTLGNGTLAPIQFFGRFESLEEDWRKVCEALGVSLPLRHINKSRRRDYRDYYDDETIEIVKMRNISLIEYFDYEF